MMSKIDVKPCNKRKRNSHINKQVTTTHTKLQKQFENGILLNTYVTEAARFSDLSMILLNLWKT